MRRTPARTALALALGLAIAIPCAAADVTVNLPAVSGSPGSTVAVPITTSPALAGLGVLSVDFRLTFNPAVVSGAQAGSDGTIQNWGPPFANGTASFIAEATAGGSSLTLPGTLLNTVHVQLKPTAVIGTVMPLVFDHITFNNGTPTVAVVNGTLTVVASAGVTPAALNTLSLAVLSTPARGEARFAIDVPQGGGPARLEVFGLDGRRIATLDGAAAAGTRTLAWDLRGPGGRRVGAGLYFARLALGANSVVRRLVVAG